MSRPDVSGSTLHAALDNLEAGIILLDKAQRILLWNRWLARRSNRDAASSLDRPLHEALPEIVDTRLADAVNHAINDGLPSLLSPALHGTLLPLYHTTAARKLDQRMHQLTHVIPLRNQADAACMIQISDVTANISRERLLRRQADALRRLSTHDALTGLSNRSTFDAELSREFAGAQRAGTPIALLIVDIDLFGRYNASYSTESGDACLASISGALQNCLRNTGDLLARYGSDEFAFLLPDIDESGCCRFAEMVRQRIDELALPFIGSGLADHLTVSIGAAVMPPSNEAGPDALISSADVALYQAKHEGRHRAVYFSVENGSFKACSQIESPPGALILNPENRKT